jgi:hypothetical protein
MKRRVLSVLCAFVMMFAPLAASQGGPKPKPVKPPKPTQTSVSKSTKPPSVKPVSVKTTTSKPPKPVKATSSKPVKSTTKATKPVKATKFANVDKGSKKPTTTASTTTTTTTTTTTGTKTGETIPLTKVQEKLKKNTNLAAKLETRLPEGTDLMKAADGFKNLGQFVAAVNVSNNHEGISFTELKTLMVEDGYSLGQAMQKLKATDATTEARRAEYEANRMIETSEVAVSTTTTTTTAKPKNSKKVVGAQQ